MSNKEKLQWFIIGVAALVWVLSIIVNFFTMQTDINTVTIAFTTTSALVLGAGVYSKLKNGKDDK